MSNNPAPNKTRLEAADYLRRRIVQSGLSARKWAALVARDERTVRRWLSGQSPIPQAVWTWLETEAGRAIHVNPAKTPQGQPL